MVAFTVIKSNQLRFSRMMYGTYW